jgi:ATP-dependent DNA ligase
MHKARKTVELFSRNGYRFASRFPRLVEVLRELPVMSAVKHGLEGVVSKRRGKPYRSGKCRAWRRIKTTAWREANRETMAMFE